MLGALALVVCLGAAGGVGWILYLLYAPRVRQPVRGIAGHVVVEPMFADKKPPVPPRTRMARGTGAVPRKAPRADSTEKIVRYAP